MKQSVSLTTDEQVEAFEAAVEAVAEDDANDLVDPDRYGGDIKRGEALRILAEAYLGRLNTTDYEATGSGEDLVTLPADAVDGTTLPSA